MDHDMASAAAKAPSFQSGSIDSPGVREKTTRTRAIDFGPFVRQEGRHPVSSHSQALREEAMRRIRMELGLPAEQTRPTERVGEHEGLTVRLRVGEGKPLWMSWLVNKLRNVG